MSENVTTLQDSNFIADINFISVNRKTGHTSYLPIDLASVTYFEINDNLIDFGLTGNVTFPNWGQLLSKLEGFGFQNPGAPKGDEERDTAAVATGMEKYLTISIKDSNIPIEEQGYEFVASAKSSASLTLNAIDVKQTLEFEENLTAVLKKISYDVFLQTKENEKVAADEAYREAVIRAFNAGEEPPERPLVPLGPEGGTVASTLLSLLNQATDFKAHMTDEVLRLDEKKFARSRFNVNDINSNFDNKVSNTSKSLYSIAQDLYNHISFGGPDNSNSTVEETGTPQNRTPFFLRKGSSLALLKTKHDPIDIKDGDADEEDEEDKEVGFWDSFSGLVKTAFSLGKTEEKEEEEEAEVKEDNDTDLDGSMQEEVLIVESKAGQRKIVIDELLSLRHLEFISEYTKLPPEVAQPSRAAIMQPDVAAVLKKEENDFSDVYMEDFSIAPDDVPNVNASIHNNVEKYDLIQPDINNLRQTIWGNYTLTNSSIDNQFLDTYEYNMLADEFETSILGGHKSNLPFIPANEVKDFKIMQTASTPQSRSLSDSRLKNIIFKSFIYLNETIVLDVKGKMYRKPGKFITIQGELCPSMVQQLWFVIEVKHKFENGNYRNEIKAVRFLADGPVIRRTSGAYYNGTGPVEKIEFGPNRVPVPVRAGGRGGAADGRAGDNTNTGPSLGGDPTFPSSLFPDGAAIPKQTEPGANASDASRDPRIGDPTYSTPPPRRNTVRIIVPPQEEEE